jgi:bifunctional oligoribonuclease and PAP phosphatase NrnA
MNNQNHNEIDHILEALGSRSRFLIATHVRPDGDAAGSVLAMTFILRRLGKEADPYCQDPILASHEFLPGSSSIRHVVEKPEAYDAAIMVDCGDFHRVGPSLEGPIGQIPYLINIDHHLSNAPFGNISWVEPTASSTCEMLYDLATSIPMSPDPDLATQLYTGLLTDTGSFRFANTTERVLEIARHLVNCGAEPSFVAEQVYDSSSPQRIQLLARVLATVEFHRSDQLVTAELSQQMFNETGTSPADTESFINHLRSVKTARMAILFREEEDGIINVSMRSKGEVDVASLARSFGGGGHYHAAACRLKGVPLHEARTQFTREALSCLA